MSESVSEEPPLPEWVQLLIISREERAYQKGWEDGRKNLWYRIQADMKARRPFDA